MSLLIYQGLHPKEVATLKSLMLIYLQRKYLFTTVSV